MAAAVILLLLGGGYGAYTYNQKQKLAAEKQQAAEHKLSDDLAKTEIDKRQLEADITACGAKCPQELKDRAKVRIESINLAHDEETDWFLAQGDITKLREYRTSCQICKYSAASSAEIQKLLKKDEEQRMQADRPVTKVLGIDLVTLSKDMRSRYNINDGVKGVVITNVDNNSEAANRSLVAGDVIVEVAQEAVSSAADVKKRLDLLMKDGKKTVLLMIANTAGALRFVAMNVQ
jgi:hypothetical protein